MVHQKKKDANGVFFLLVNLTEHIICADREVAALMEREGGTRNRFPLHTTPSLRGGWLAIDTFRSFLLVNLWECKNCADWVGG